MHMVEMDSGDPDGGIRRVQEESGRQKEKEEGECAGVDEASAVATAVARTVGGEDYDDVLVWRLRAWVRGKGRIRNEVVLPRHVWQFGSFP